MIQSLGININIPYLIFLSLIKYRMSRDDIHMGTNTNKTLKNMGTKRN